MLCGLIPKVRGASVEKSIRGKDPHGTHTSRAIRNHRGSVHPRFVGVDEAQRKTRFVCHAAYAKEHYFVFTQYAP
jgi:hypothetical protein